MKSINNLSLLEKCSIGLSIALFACLLPLPYGFYTLIRLATAVIAGCWAYKFYRSNKNAMAVVSGFIVILFQPISKIALDRTTWNIVDIALAILIIFMCFRDK